VVEGNIRPVQATPKKEKEIGTRKGRTLPTSPRGSPGGTKSIITTREAHKKRKKLVVEKGGISRAEGVKYSKLWFARLKRTKKEEVVGRRASVEEFAASTEKAYRRGGGLFVTS